MLLVFICVQTLPWLNFLSKAWVCRSIAVYKCERQTQRVNEGGNQALDGTGLQLRLLGRQEQLRFERTLVVSLGAGICTAKQILVYLGFQLLYIDLYLGQKQVERGYRTAPAPTGV